METKEKALKHFTYRVSILVSNNNTFSFSLYVIHVCVSLFKSNVKHIINISDFHSNNTYILSVYCTTYRYDMCIVFSFFIIIIIQMKYYWAFCVCICVRLWRKVQFQTNSLIFYHFHSEMTFSYVLAYRKLLLKLVILQNKKPYHETG